MLGFVTTMTNVSGHAVSLGSPTTEGRDNAGYGGLFWRGPAGFAGGRVLTAAGDGVMGGRGPWLAFATPAATLVFRDSRANPGFPCRWFVRSTPYACAGPAPFFAAPVPVPAAAELTLGYQVVVADGEQDIDAIGAFFD